FLYWPKTGTAVVPLSSHADGRFRTGALVLKITDAEVTRTGTIEHPSRTTGDQPGIQRSMVIGEEIWTFSYEGVQVNDLATLDELGGAEPDRVGLLVGVLLLGQALGLDPLGVVLDLALDLVVVPAERPGEEFGGLLGDGDAAVEGLDGDVRAPGQHVVEVAGA